MNNLLNLPDLSNNLLKIKKNTGLVIGLALSTLGLTSGQLKPAEQGAIQEEILNNNPSIVAATPPSKPKPKPGPIPGEGRPRFVDLQTEDTETEDLIIAGVRVRVKGEPTRSNDSKRRSYEIRQEKV